MKTENKASLFKSAKLRKLRKENAEGRKKGDEIQKKRDETMKKIKEQDKINGTLIHQLLHKKEEK